MSPKIPGCYCTYPLSSSPMTGPCECVGILYPPLSYITRQRWGTVQIKLRFLIHWLWVNQKRDYPGWVWPNQEALYIESERLSWPWRSKLLWVPQLQGNEAGQQPHEPGRRDVSDETLTDTPLSALGYAKERTQLCHMRIFDSWKLRNKNTGVVLSL